MAQEKALSPGIASHKGSRAATALKELEGPGGRDAEVDAAADAVQAFLEGNRAAMR